MEHAAMQKAGGRPAHDAGTVSGNCILLLRVELRLCTCFVNTVCNLDPCLKGFCCRSQSFYPVTHCILPLYSCVAETILKCLTAAHGCQLFLIRSCKITSGCNGLCSTYICVCCLLTAFSR